MTHRLKGGDFALAGGDVVDGYAAVGLGREPVVEQEAVGNLRHALVAPVLGSEVHVCSPVVAEIVGGTTGRAGSNRRDVRLWHRRVEGVASHNLVHMRARHLVWLDKRVETLDGNLRAAESKVVQPVEELGVGDRRQGETGPQHGVSRQWW